MKLLQEPVAPVGWVHARPPAPYHAEMKTSSALILAGALICWKFSQLSEEGRSNAIEAVTQYLESILFDPVGSAMQLYKSMEESGGATMLLAAIACKLIARKFRRSAEKKRAAAEKDAEEKASAAAAAQAANGKKKNKKAE